MAGGKKAVMINYVSFFFLCFFNSSKNRKNKVFEKYIKKEDEEIKPNILICSLMEGKIISDN